MGVPNLNMTSSPGDTLASEGAPDGTNRKTTVPFRVLFLIGTLLVLVGAAATFNFDSFTITASKTVMAARQQTRNNGRRLLRFTKKLTSAKSPHKRRLLAKKLMTLSAKRFNLQAEFAR